MSTAITDLTRVGDGPVATVYTGHHDGVPVALKVFPKRLDKRTMSAFTKEQAKLGTVRRVTSILMVDAVEELASGETALRMELCTQSLAGLVERVGPLAAADVIILGRAVAVGLTAAHGAGVVHGGVAPDNVLFRANSEPAIGDFGVTLRQAFTRDPLHAIEYLPPETLRTGTLNEATDLYGLGAVLHFALSGRSPHPGRLGEQPGERVLRILGEPVPAINRPDVPVGLATLVARLLSTAPDRRPTDAAQVADQLTSMLPNPPKAAPREDWDDFDTPAPVAVHRPQPQIRPTPEEDLDFDDFAAPHPAARPLTPASGHRSPYARPPVHQPVVLPAPAARAQSVAQSVAGGGAVPGPVPPPAARPSVQSSVPQSVVPPVAAAVPPSVELPGGPVAQDQVARAVAGAGIAPVARPRPVAEGHGDLPSAATPVAPTATETPIAQSPLPLAPPLTPVVPSDGVLQEAPATEVFPLPDMATVRLPIAPSAQRRPTNLDFDDDGFGDFGDANRLGQAKVLAGPLAPPGQSPKRLIRYDLLAGLALLLALAALVPLLLLRSDPEEIATTPRVPAAAGPAAPDVKVELEQPTDLTTKVELTWTASAELDFAVVVAGEGEQRRWLLAERDHSMTVEVKPGKKYCFVVQATDGERTYESKPVAFRGATCTNT